MHIVIFLEFFSTPSSQARSSVQSMPYEELLSGMEKAELLAKAVMLGHLLVRVDETNPMWHGMYADTLIVKGKVI